jgi:hypothetical protein
MHYLLFYEKAADYAARQGPLQPAHRAHLSAAVRRGELLLAGSLADPVVARRCCCFRPTRRPSWKRARPPTRSSSMAW